jgi:hypothetical protein
MFIIRGALMIVGLYTVGKWLVKAGIAYDRATTGRRPA